ncbi:MAG: TIGR03767 family metallophosphoesterase [Actinomycetota bacterium]|nr:TIGR03767 family metallophosphoesterase [Actinomycetota bacterium]
MKLTRRNLFRSGAVAGGVTAATTAAGSGSAAAVADREAAAAATTATTGTTLAKGPAGVGGYRPVVTAAGEAHLLRTDLVIDAKVGRATGRVPLIAFAQLSDVHVVDAQSPMRLEFVDRLDDPSPIPPTLFSSAYRPHEMLSGQIADSMVREINAIGRGPVTGKPLSLAIQTGDNSDNSQLNEVRWNIQLLNGGTIRVDSGNLGTYEGVADGNTTYYDPAYWHPHGTPAFKTDDVYRKRYGFPVVPGLLDAARRPFEAQGLNVPWFCAFGNHDGLVQGNFPQNLQLGLISTGALKIMSTPAGLSPAELVNSLMTGDILGVLQSLVLTPSVRPVTPDTNRQLLTRKGFIEQHFVHSDGHGFTAENRATGTAYYTFDRGACRFIVLDTVNPNGYSDGSIDQAQFAWLEEVLSQSAGMAVMIFSHHTSWTMANTLVATGGDLESRISGAQVLERLLSHPEVIAWINGHTHRNQIVAHTRPEGGGLWEINTAAHIDWPQQSRLIEVTDNRDDTLSIFTTMVDHSGPASYAGNTGDAAHLAGLGRELAANDPQNRTDAGRGQVGDRNVELLVKAPPSWGLARPTRPGPGHRGPGRGD